MTSSTVLITVFLVVSVVSAFDPLSQSAASDGAVVVYQPGRIVIRAKRQCNGCGCGGCNCGSVGICGATCCPSPPPPCSCGTPGCCTQTAVAVVPVQVQTCCKCCQPVCTTACINGGGCGCGCTRGGCGRKRRSLQAIEVEHLRSMAATDVFN